jgi:transcriptional regulator NrdR family protein
MVKRLVLNAERFKRLVDGIILQFDKDESPFTPKKYYRDITSQLIGALVLASLKDLDIIGYYRYASVFLRLYDLNGYQTLLDTIDPSTEPLPEQYVGDVTT